VADRRKKFVDDPEIIAELGDFSSPASMGRVGRLPRDAGLVQFGFTNSHPDFTKGGDHLWSPSLTQETLAETPNVGFVREERQEGGRFSTSRTDWGKSSFEHLRRRRQAAGHRDQLQLRVSLPRLEPTFRPILINGAATRIPRPSCISGTGRTGR